ncbi:MAG: HNH endonuclease [Nocardioidaceae bacterium]|nr:HNH endonuclease [Nocardioidaceae bacterium]
MQVDEIIAGDPVALSQRGDRETVAAIQEIAARLDAASLARRRRYAESERRVGIRPAPDSMVFLTTLLPMATGIGVYAALKAHATTAVGTGQATSIGAATADELVRRITGVTATHPQPVTLRLTMPVGVLFDHTDDPAHLEDHGILPAEAARALLADNLDTSAKVWLKRLFTHPETGDLIAMDSRARLFPATLGEFLDIRDRWCRTPWCDAPIRHHDHVKSHAEGGETSAFNGQGLCAACNQAKEAPGWSARPAPGPRHTVEITTPTGHRYRSRAPAA